MKENSILRYGLMLSFAALGFSNIYNEHHSKINSIKQKENYIEVIQGRDTLKYFQHNDSIYRTTPKEIIEAQYKTDSLKRSYELKIDSIQGELEEKLNRIEKELK